MNPPISRVACVALNPALDQTIEVADLRIGEVNRAGTMQVDIGGKGINVASCLADFGIPPAVLGLLGRDNAALFEEAFLRKQIVNHCFYADGLTRINTKLVDHVRNETTDINMPGRELTPLEASGVLETLHAALDTLLLHTQWVVLAGSLPPGMPEDTYAQLTEYVRLAGRSVMLDASGEPLRAALAAGPTIVKPNRHELAELVGHPLASMEAVVSAGRRLFERTSGLRMVVVSLGAEGALFLTQDRALHAHPADVAVTSTVGAGDAMVAGLIAAQLQGLSLESGAQLATAFSGAKLGRLGPHLPAADIVRALARTIQITPLL